MMTLELKQQFEQHMKNMDGTERLQFLLFAVARLRETGATTEDAYDAVFGAGHYAAMISAACADAS